MPQVFSSGANTLAKLSLITAAILPFGVLYAGSTFTRSSANTNVGVAIDQPVFFSHKHHAFELGIDCRYCHTSVEKSPVAGVPPTETCMSCHSQIWLNSPLLEPLRQSYETGESLVWNKVNKVPEFVYFNHSIHIARGVSCNECHGAVTKMQMTAKGRDLSMSWCLECHRNPEKYLYVEGEEGRGASPAERVFDLYDKQRRGEQLSTREFNLLNDKTTVPTAEQVRNGEQQVERLGVKKQQLMDCWICHR